MNKDYINSVEYETSLFKRACKEGNIDLVKTLIPKVQKQFFQDTISKGLYNATEKGHINIVNFLEPTIWGGGLERACRGGHIDIVKLMIKNGASFTSWSIGHACRGGSIDIINLVINDQGPTNCDWDWGLYGACKGGHMDIVQLMISKGAKDFDDCFYGACYGGNLDIVKFIFEKVEDHEIQDFFIACKKGRTDVVKFILSKKEHLDFDLTPGYRKACEQGHTEIVNMILQCGYTNDDKFPYDFPYKNIKTKYYHNDLYATNVASDYFIHSNILYWTIVYNKHKEHKKCDIVQKDLIPDLLKILYF